MSDLESDTEDPSNNIQVPEICQICNEKLKNPVITLCEHFFCEKCALTQYSKSANCYVCKRPTNGTFNEGGKVIKKLKDIKDSLKKIKGKDKTKNTIKEISEDREFEMPDIDENEKRKLLEGVEFGVDKVGEDEELKGLAGEFIRKRAKQKSQIKYDSDWLV